MSNIYNDGTYLAKNSDWHASDSVWKASQICRILEKNSIDVNSVCEIGCGAGEVLRLVQSGMQGSVTATGYDISPQAYKIFSSKTLQEDAQPPLRYVLGDLLADDLAEFELVLAIDVFEHVENYIGFLQELRSKAKYFVFHVPLDLSCQSVARPSKLSDIREAVGHLHYFTKDTALKTIEYSGYLIEDWFYTRGSLELPARGWKSNLANIPRRAISVFSEDISARILGGYSIMVLARSGQDS